MTQMSLGSCREQSGISFTGVRTAECSAMSPSSRHQMLPAVLYYEHSPLGLQDTYTQPEAAAEAVGFWLRLAEHLEKAEERI